MFESYHAIAGQFFGLISLLLCILAFSSKQDDRLMVLLICANFTFALQFFFFASWTAAALTVLIIGRIALARRYPRNRTVMLIVLAVSGVVALLTWQSWKDIPAIVAMIFGTVGMFMLRGIAMRAFLGLAALGWIASNLLAGSVGGTIAESLLFTTNAVTIYRLLRARDMYSECS